MGLSLTVMQGSISKEDPVIHEFVKSDGKQGKLALFRVAVQRDYKDKDGNKLYDFFTCKAFGSAANYVEKFYRKGDLVVVQGRMQNEEYERNGVTYRHDVLYISYTTASNLRSADKGQKQSAVPSQIPTGPTGMEDEMLNDDLPPLPDDLLPITPEDEMPFK